MDKNDFKRVDVSEMGQDMFSDDLENSIEDLTQSQEKDEKNPFFKFVRKTVKEEASEEASVNTDSAADKTPDAEKSSKAESPETEEKSTEAPDNKKPGKKKEKKSRKAQKLNKAEKGEKPEEKKGRKKLSAFTKGVLIYTAVLLIAAIVVLAVLHSFLVAFEHSRPMNVVNEYLSSVSENGITDNCRAAFEPLDKNLQTEEECEAYFMEILPELKFSKSSKLSGPGQLAYILSYNKEPIGAVYLKELEEHPFGLSFWSFEKDGYDFSSLTNSHSLLLPSDYSVSVNGRELGDEYIEKKDIAYKSLSSYSESYSGFPSMVQYESGKYMGPESLVIKDAKGNEVSQDALSEADFLNNCSDKTLADVKAFTDNYVNHYVAYTSNVNQAPFINLMRLRNLVIPGGTLEARLSQAIGSFGFSTILSCEVTENDINICYEQDGKYFVDITYVTETLGRAEPVVADNHIRVVVVPQPTGGYLAEAMYNY